MGLLTCGLYLAICRAIRHAKDIHDEQLARLPPEPVSGPNATVSVSVAMDCVSAGLPTV